MSRSSSNSRISSYGRHTSHLVRFGFLSLVAIVALSGTTHADIILDGSFASPAIPSNSSVLDPTGSPWTFVSNSGIINNSTLWESGGVPAVNPAVNGPQVGYIQSQGFFGNGQVGSFNQTIALPANGTYQLSFYLAGRLGPSGEGGDLPFNIYLGATEIGSDESSTGMAFQMQSFTFNAAAGTYDLLFQGMAPVPDTNIFQDNTAFFDVMSIAAVPEPNSLVLTGLPLIIAIVVIRMRRSKGRSVEPQAS
jgi:hypothetical protein